MFPFLEVSESCTCQTKNENQKKSQDIGIGDPAQRRGTRNSHEANRGPAQEDFRHLLKTLITKTFLEAQTFKLCLKESGPSYCWKEYYWGLASSFDSVLKLMQGLLSGSLPFRTVSENARMGLVNLCVFKTACLSLKFILCSVQFYELWYAVSV